MYTLDSSNGYCSSTHQLFIHSPLHDHCCSTNGRQLLKHFTEVLRYLQCVINKLMKAKSITNN